MAYQYRMVQTPRSISVTGAEEGNEAARYLESLVNGQVQEGWEFFRVDSIGVEVRPGCLAGLLHTLTQGILGSGITHDTYYVVTFRREA